MREYFKDNLDNYYNFFIMLFHVVMVVFIIILS